MQLPSYRWRALHLAALWAYGVSQPVFSMLKGNPEFLVVRGSTRMDVVVFALLVTFVPPLAVVGAEAVVAVVSRTLAGALHVVAIWCFGFLVAVQLVRLLDAQPAAVLLIPVAIAAVAALLYPRSRLFQSFLSVSFALPVIGLLGFVATVPLATDDAAAADVRVANSTPVVLVVMDEFPVSSLLEADGSIDARRYPNFARLADESTWYRRATTVHEFTTQAVPAILTGQLPHDGELPTLNDHPRNLFTLLGEGYHLRVVEPVTRLCPERYCPDAHESPPFLDRARGLLYDSTVGYLYRVLPASLRTGLPPIGDRWGGFGESSDDTTRERLLGALNMDDVNLAIEQSDHRPRFEFERFMRLIRPHDASRTLYFAHLMLPHAPYRMLPSGSEYGNAETIDGIVDDAFDQWGDSPLLVDQALQRHLLQVGYTDRLLGELLHRLKATGIYDRALVVVTADHGASFEPAGHRRMVYGGNIADIAAVPLFVKYPHERQGRADDRNARTVDVVPTIADVLGVRLPWQVDGRTLRGAPVQGRRVMVWRRAGGVVTADTDDVHAGMLATASRNEALFGVGRDVPSPGPYKQLVGRSVVGLGATEQRGTEVMLDGEVLFANVRRASHFVPARITGEIDRTSLAPDTALAVAVNGRVAATTRTFVLDRRLRFAALVPESSFVDGRNAVDVLAISGAPGRPSLTELGGTSGAPQYALTADGTGIALPSRRVAALAGKRLAGQMETPTVEHGTIRLRGWAADLRDRSLVDRVVIFSGRRLVFSSATTVFRWDIGDIPRTVGSARVGFVAELPLDAVRGKALRIFAIRGTVASELLVPEPDQRLLAVADHR
jgi:hypothetical protein